MGLAYKIIQDGKVAVQLAEIRCFEGAAFQFNRNEGIEFTVEEEQIYLESVAFYINGILILDKKVSSRIPRAAHARIVQRHNSASHKN